MNLSNVIEAVDNLFCFQNNPSYSHEYLGKELVRQCRDPVCTDKATFNQVVAWCPESPSNDILWLLYHTSSQPECHISKLRLFALLVESYDSRAYLGTFYPGAPQGYYYCNNFLLLLSPYTLSQIMLENICLFQIKGNRLSNWKTFSNVASRNENHCLLDFYMSSCVIRV